MLKTMPNNLQTNGSPKRLHKNTGHVPNLDVALMVKHNMQIGLDCHHQCIV